MSTTSALLAGQPALRVWQREALVAYNVHTENVFTVTATPGAGKTTLALTIARQLLDARKISRVIVVTPTDHLRTQWADAAQAMGVALDAKLDNASRSRAGDDGYVATYAQIAAKPVLHARRAETPSLVVFDEIHHAGDELSWGDAISEAFGDASRVLTLTGTPYRTSTIERIPFLTYVPGDEPDTWQSVADYQYGYGDALADRVVRPVVFAAYAGEVRWRTCAGDVLAIDLAGESTRKQEDAAWRAVLDPNGQWVRSVVAAADRHLAETRSLVPDAGCLYLASDQESARAYARVVKEVTGHKATVVVSDDPNASKKIAAFDAGTDRYLIAVRMVSEGVDIRRLTTLVWLTAARTPLFFSQAVGRVLRARTHSEIATVFLPSVRPLLALAAELETERDHIVTPPAAVNEDDALLAAANASDPSSGDPAPTLLDTQARFAHFVAAGQAVVARAAASAETDGNTHVGAETEFDGLPGLFTPEQLARQDAHRLASAGSRARLSRAANPAASEEDRKRVRKDLQSLTNAAARAWGVPVAAAHVRVRQAVPGPPPSSASFDVLESRRDWLLGQLPQ